MKNVDFLSALEAAQMGTFEWRVKENEIIWSAQAERLHGLEPGEFRGTFEHGAELTHPDDLDRVMRLQQEAKARGGDFRYSFRVIWPRDKSVHWLSCSGRIFVDAKHHPVRIAGILFENTAQKTSELALAASEEKFRTLNSMAPVGIFETDESGNCLSVNQRWSELTGLSPELASGQGWTNSLHPEDKLRVLKEWYEAALAGREFASEYRFQRPNGDACWVAGAAVALKDAFGKLTGFIGTVQDVSRLKTAERELQYALKARDELMAICAHEFKTPLSSLRIQTQTALKRVTLGDPSAFESTRVQKLLRVYSSQVDRLVRLVDDMLEVTQVQNGKLPLNLERVNLSELVTDTVDRFQEQIEISGSRVDTSLWPEVIGHWDRFRIEQVVVNLLTNAMKYGNKRPISISVSSQDGAAHLKVEDQGIGIAEDNHERIFDRYERAISATDVSGLGIGLYIVRSIVDAHEGRITVESKLNEGARFTVCLPLPRDPNV